VIGIIFDTTYSEHEDALHKGATGNVDSDIDKLYWSVRTDLEKANMWHEI
jgi:hypothetical protein